MGQSGSLLEIQAKGGEAHTQPPPPPWPHTQAGMGERTGRNSLQELVLYQLKNGRR